MNIIGLSAYHHESGCCLLKDGEVVAAVPEERFTRVRHCWRFPVTAFRFCLEAGRIGITDVDRIAYFESSEKKLSRQLWAGNRQETPFMFPWPDPQKPERDIREVLGFEGVIETFEHHRSHAASAFFFSGFPDAAIFTADGVGEWATTTYGVGRDAIIDIFEEVYFPDSLGLLYGAIASYLGFDVDGGDYRVLGDGEHKAMQLAAYGEPRHVDRLQTLIEMAPQGQYKLNMDYFGFVQGNRLYADRLCDLLGSPPRTKEAELTTFHMDVAKSLQVLFEEILMKKLEYLHRRVASDHLCLAGGVAANSTAIGRIAKEGPFKRLYVPPAAGNMGACLGAAALAHAKLATHPLPARQTEHAFWGPRYSTVEIAKILSGTGLLALDFRDREPALLEAVVDRLVQQKIVAWFHGAMEFGTHGYGARSMIADPRSATIRERLNRQVKQREDFLSYASCVLLGHASRHFDLDHSSPFGLQSCRVRSPLNLVAVTHADGTARVQTVGADQSPRFAALLETFYRRTGCPILLNTSFSVRRDPIVCNPTEALLCFVRSDIDALILEDFLLDREMLPAHWTSMPARGFRSTWMDMVG